MSWQLLVPVSAREGAPPHIDSDDTVDGKTQQRNAARERKPTGLEEIRDVGERDPRRRSRPRQQHTRRRHHVRAVLVIERVHGA